MTTTHISVVLDRSGSMQSILDDAIGGFNSFVRQQAALPGHATFSLALFDHEYAVPYSYVDIGKAPELDRETFVPRGTTALLDAIGRTIDDLGSHFQSLPESERPRKVIVAILTDGMENSSSDYSVKDVADRIEHQRSKYAWEFVFLAANQDAIRTGTSFNIPSNNAVSFKASPSGSRHAFHRMSEIVCEMRDDEL